MEKNNIGERTRAFLLLTLNVIVWLLLFIVSLPIVLWKGVKRIFVKAK